MSLVKAMTASKSLVSHEIYADTDFGWSDTSFDRSIIQAIVENPKLHHVHLDGCMLSKNVCHSLYCVLADKSCEIESLSLNMQERETPEADLSLIVQGIASNHSIECLGFESWDDDAITSFLSSLQNVSLDFLEKLDLNGSDTNIMSECVTTIARTSQS
jgi:hypothetical protein